VASEAVNYWRKTPITEHILRWHVRLRQCCVRKTSRLSRAGSDEGYCRLYVTPSYPRGAPLRALARYSSSKRATINAHRGRDKLMLRTKKASRRKRRTSAVPMLAGLSLSLASGPAAAIGGVSQDLAISSIARQVMDEEEILDVRLTTFHVFDGDSANAPRTRPTIAAAACGACGADLYYPQNPPTVDPLVPRAEKLVLVLEAIGDDKERVNSTSIDNPLVTLKIRRLRLSRSGSGFMDAERPGTRNSLTSTQPALARRATGRKRTDGSHGAMSQRNARRCTASHTVTPGGGTLDA
jgi:hypothetical protein